MALLSRKEKRLTTSYSNKHEISSADIKKLLRKVVKEELESHEKNINDLMNSNLQTTRDKL